MKLSDEEIGALRLVERYGDGIDFGGARIGRRVKDVARSLIARGLLAGTYRSCRITDAGREAIREMERI